jgi:hypothetical protein
MPKIKSQRKAGSDCASHILGAKEKRIPKGFPALELVRLQ